MTVTYNPKKLQDALDALIAAQCDDNMLTFKHMVEDPRLSGLRPYLLKKKWESWPTTGDELLDSYFGSPDGTAALTVPVKDNIHQKSSPSRYTKSKQED